MRTGAIFSSPLVRYTARNIPDSYRATSLASLPKWRAHVRPANIRPRNHANENPGPASWPANIRSETE